MTASGTWQVEPLPPQLTWQPPGDVRAGLCALACAALADQPSSIWGVPECEPLISLRRVLAHLGVQFVRQDEEWLAVHPPPDGLAWSGEELDCGCDIETALVTLGVCAHLPEQDVRLRCADICRSAELEQAQSLLEQLGVQLEFEVQSEACTLSVARQPAPAAPRIQLASSTHLLKPMVMLAALASGQAVTVHDLSSGADHIERALQTLGLEIARDGRDLRFQDGRKLRGRTLRVPPDVSCVAPLIISTAARPEEASLDIPIVGVNPSRVAYLRCLTRAGANLLRLRDWQFGNEPVAVLEVAGGGDLRGFSVPPNAAPAMLGELLPLLAFASQCMGVTRVAGLAPLGGGTPERLTLALQMLGAGGVHTELEGSVTTVTGRTPLGTAELNCADDLLLGLLGLTLALLAGEPVTLYGMSALDRWWPELRTACTRSETVEAV